MSREEHSRFLPHYRNLYVDFDKAESSVLSQKKQLMVAFQ